MKTPKQTDPQFKLRLTPDLDQAIEREAAKSGRTKNAEILMRLERSFSISENQSEQIKTLEDDLAKQKEANSYATTITRILVSAIQNAADGDKTMLGRLLEQARIEPFPGSLVVRWRDVAPDNKDDTE